MHDTPAPPSPSALPASLLEELVRLGPSRQYPKGAIIVTEGEPALSMYVIQQGRLKVYVSGDDGREVELNVLGPGEYFGELMLDGQVRSASVIALTPARLTMIVRADFERTLLQRPDIAFHVIQHLIQRVRALSRNVQGLASKDVYGRIVQLFDELAREEGGTRVVPGPLSQQTIADRVGASRSMVNRILQDLTAGGYVQVSRERIVLNKPLPRHW
jgi:CRP/FNR family cyclic AMP-dependent transcriptional regulator